MTKAQMQAYRRLRAAVDRLEPRLQRQVREALLALQNSIKLDRLERALASRDPFAIVDMVASLPARLRPAVRTMAEGFTAGAGVGKAVLYSMGVGVQFDATNPFAVEAARQNSARFVTLVTNETKKAIKTIITRALNEGISPTETARLVRPLIGLSTRQAQAVEALRADLIQEGVSRRLVDRAAARQSQRLLNYRSKLIARTEIMQASNDGELSAWREARRLGLLGRPNKQWIVTPDDHLCKICRPLNGQTVALDQKFKTRLGLYDGPPLHPSCRCTVGLVPGLRKRAA